MQKKIHSLLESLLNVIVGFIISYAISFIVYPLFGIPVNPTKYLGIVLIYTVISVIRSYVIRRYFNGKLVKLYEGNQ